MPKTKNAFALRNFDPARILSRKFFDSLNPEKLTDEELLNYLEPLPEDYYNELEIKADFFKNALEKSLRYRRNIIDRQQYRLLRYLELITDKIFANNATESEIERGRRAKKLRDKYSEIESSIRELEKKLFKGKEMCDKNFDILCRIEFAFKLKQARKKAGWTQTDLSDKTGINRTDIALYETQKKFPSFLNLVKLCRAGVSMDFLMRGEA